MLRSPSCFRLLSTFLGKSNLLVFGSDIATSLLSSFGEDTLCNFINNMIKESQYCSYVMKKLLTKNL